MSEKHYDAAYLNETAKIFQQVKISSYKKFENLNKGTIVDIGCGAGDDVIALAQMFQDNIEVIGLDHDAQLISLAKSKLAQNTSAQFILSDGEVLPFENNTIDGIRAERLIQHLKDAPKVFQEIFRVLKNNSKVVIVETDWSSLCFYNGNVNTATKVVDYMTNHKINNGFAAKKVLVYFKNNNFQNPSIEVFNLKTNQLVDAFNYLWIDKVLQEMQQLNFLSQVELDDFLNALKKADNNSSFICSINIVLCTAIKN